MTKHILALDIGTQSTRAALVAVGGRIVRIEQIRHEVDSPEPGWAQQQPDASLGSVAATPVKRKLMKSLGVRNQRVRSYASGWRSLHHRTFRPIHAGLTGLPDRAASCCSSWARRTSEHCGSHRLSHQSCTQGVVVSPRWSTPTGPCICPQVETAA
ncbi:MAG: FGGY family carbohydrate kinase, partial [Patescibacteria group bacterium]|nr:FGGY family carbohydrate kinase [Patescibacteria group bacterium]